MIAHGANQDETVPFNSGRGFVAAAVMGMIHPYWYVRGAALSLLEDPGPILPYTESWPDIAPAEHLGSEVYAPCPQTTASAFTSRMRVWWR